MRRAIYPGSFDPITLGHLDLVQRASKLFDQLLVGVGTNPAKARLLDDAERVDLTKSVVAHLPNVEVVAFSGLLVDFCREHEVIAIVKGLRTASDFDYEIAQAQMNAHLTGVQTVYLPTHPQHSFVSSSLVKEVASLGGDVSRLLPELARQAILHKLS